MLKPLSRRQVVCNECGEVFDRFSYLEQHFQRKHPGKPCREKKQSSLLDHLRAGSKRPAATDQDLASKKPENSESTSGSDPALVSHLDPVLQDDQQLPTSRISSPFGSHLDPPHLDPPHLDPAHLDPPHCDPPHCDPPLLDQQPSTSRTSSAPHNQDTNLLKQIQNVLDQWSCSSQVTQPPAKPTPLLFTEPPLKQAEDSQSQIKDRITACRSLNDFDVLLDDTFRLDREKEMIICLCCEKADSSKHRGMDTSEVEWEKLASKSRKLRNLQSHLVLHINSESHLKHVLHQQEAVEEEKRKQNKNLEVGRKLGSLAYFIFFNKLPFSFYEKIVPWMALVKIDIGQINHSEQFIRRLLEPCFTELKKRLQRHLNQVLPCTDQLRPLNITADKGTIKHDCNQVTMIRTPALKNGHLFESFFLAHPEVNSHKGNHVSELILKVCSDQLNLSFEDLRHRISGACFDGQYIHLNVRSHFSEMLHLPVEFFEDSVIWDAAHRLELAYDNAKNGKNDQRGRCIINPSPWLQELDSVLQHVMTKFRLGKNHSDLRSVAHELGETFLEFCLFSETRFMEYAHRSYDHFLKMFHILFEKIQRDELASETSKDSESLENLEKMLVQAHTVTDLLFMNELSNIMTLCSKSFQKFDVLPFEPFHAFNNLIKKLEHAKDCFENDRSPSINSTDSNSDTQWNWGFFKKSVEEICESQTFKGVKLLVPGDRGRVTRSGISYGYDKESFSAMVLTRFRHYAKFLSELIDSLKNRFEPWPQWMLLCNETFNFSNELPLADRQAALEILMDCPFGPSPLLNDEKKRISAEYLTTVLNAEKVVKESNHEISQKDIWYELLTKEPLYKNCKKLNAFAILFLNRSFNEAIVEVEVSSLKNISTERRPLLQKTTEMLDFISTNGPHPLVSMQLVDDFLDAHFGKDWHFTINQSKWLVSKVVDQHFKSAKEMPNSLI